MRWIVSLLLILQCLSAEAHDYYNQKWFDYPEIGTLPRISNAGCGKQVCTKVPHMHHFHLSMQMACKCINPLVRTELLRRDVRVVVSGPDTIDHAVVNTLEGYAAGCVASAIAVSTAGPQVVASPAGFYASFKTCILALSVQGTAGALIKEFNIHLATGTHWSPL